MVAFRVEPSAVLVVLASNGKEFQKEKKYIGQVRTSSIRVLHPYRAGVQSEPDCSSPPYIHTSLSSHKMTVALALVALCTQPTEAPLALKQASVTASLTPCQRCCSPGGECMACRCCYSAFSMLRICIECPSLFTSNTLRRVLVRRQERLDGNRLGRLQGHAREVLRRHSGTGILLPRGRRGGRRWRKVL